jgi:hypothetical protein
VPKYVTPNFPASRIEEGKPERQLSLLKGPRQRGIVPRERASEFELHCAVADTLRVSLTKGWWWTTIDHGEERPVTAGERLKRKGVQPGLPDLLLIDADGKHYWIELKTNKGRLSADQKHFEEMLGDRIWWAVAYGYEAAIDILKQIGAVRVTL